MKKFFIAIIFLGFVIAGANYFSSSHKYANVAIKPMAKLGQVFTKCNFAGKVLVTKVIDGDTIIVQGGQHVRLIGIDSDEKNYPCFNAAKLELENLILNKEIILEKDVSDVDQYNRCLDYVFLDNQNINIEMVKRGLAVARFYKPDIKYKSEIQLAEKQAIASKAGCKWSTP